MICSLTYIVCSHCWWRAGCMKKLSQCSTNSLWTGRDLHRATSTRTRDIGFASLIQRITVKKRIWITSTSTFNTFNSLCVCLLSDNWILRTKRSICTLIRIHNSSTTKCFQFAIYICCCCNKLAIMIKKIKFCFSYYSYQFTMDILQVHPNQSYRNFCCLSAPLGVGVNFFGQIYWIIFIQTWIKTSLVAENSSWFL